MPICRRARRSQFVSRVRPKSRKVYPVRQPGVFPGDDNGGHANFGSALDRLPGRLRTYYCDEFSGNSRRRRGAFAERRLRREGARLRLAPRPTLVGVCGHARRKHGRQSLHRCRDCERSRRGGYGFRGRNSARWRGLGSGAARTAGAGASERKFLQTSRRTSADYRHHRNQRQDHYGVYRRGNSAGRRTQERTGRYGRVSPAGRDSAPRLTPRPSHWNSIGCSLARWLAEPPKR